MDVRRFALGDLEKIARRFGSIAKDLDVDLDDEVFPYEKPGPDHLRFFTALGSMGLHYELNQLVETGRKAASRKHSDLLREWEKDQARESRRPSRPAHRAHRPAVLKAVDLDDPLFVFFPPSPRRRPGSIPIRIRIEDGSRPSPG